jgi:hypothetical protein
LLKLVDLTPQHLTGVNANIPLVFIMVR